MNLRRVLVSLVITSFLSVFFTPSRSAVGNEIDDNILEVYMADPFVADEIERFRELGYEEGEPRGVLIGRGCGVAGCGYSMLIAHSFGSTGANPQTYSILALVQVDPFGEITSVERMELRPMAPTLRIDGKIPAPAPELRTDGRVPAPSPELRIDERIPAPSPEHRAIGKIPAPAPEISAEPIRNEP